MSARLASVVDSGGPPPEPSSDVPGDERPTSAGDALELDDLEPVPLDRRYRDLSVRVTLARRVPPTGLPRLRSAAEVHRDFAALAALDREAFLVLLLDQKNRVSGVHVVSVGSLAASLVHPREVFKAAILGNAAAILVIHNHPSGDPTPSREDRDITTRLRLCGEALGIPVVDHVIVAADGYRSFAESGLL